MKAAVLYEFGAPLEICGDVEVPPLQRGQVLVRLAYSGVCQSQLMEVRGRRGDDPFLPHLLGHEGSGLVVGLGPDVTKVMQGDKVVIGWIRSSGIEAPVPSYTRGGEILNAGRVTTFNEYAVVSENRCIALPDGVPLDVGVLFGCALPTGAGIVSNTMRPNPGASVAIVGVGGVGLSALLALALFDCEIVVAVDISDDKLRLAADLGATHTVNARQRDPVEAIRELTKGRGVDFAIEAAGRSDTIEQAFAAVRREGGLCVFASHPEAGARITLDPFELICGKRISGTWGGASNPDRDVPVFSDLYLEGKLPLERLISHRYALEDINEALEDLEQHRTSRPLIEIDPSLANGS
jgi:S-(hydroxymethyl)glutathione dehydrogenase/alcohol dehydrogenase